MQSRQGTITLATNNNYQLPKRKRMPSKHAQSIKELARMNERKTKKQKLIEPIEEDPLLNMNTPEENNNTLPCILPGQTKKLKLSIIIKKKPIHKSKKTSIVPQIQKEKKGDTSKTKGLFAAILQVTTQLEEDDKKKEEIDNVIQQGKRESEKNLRQARLKKQKEEEEKYLRFYQRYKKLNDKLQENMTDVFTL